MRVRQGGGGGSGSGGLECEMKLGVSDSDRLPADIKPVAWAPLALNDSSGEDGWVRGTWMHGDGDVSQVLCSRPDLQRRQPVVFQLAVNFQEQEEEEQEEGTVVLSGSVAFLSSGVRANALSDTCLLRRC